MLTAIMTSPDLAEVLFLIATIIFAIAAVALFGAPRGSGLAGREPALVATGLAVLAFAFLAL